MWCFHEVYVCCFSIEKERVIILKKGYIYSMISAMFFGISGMFIKFVYKMGLNAVELLTVQYIIAVILMFIWIYLFNKQDLRVSKRELLHLLILGVVGNTFMTLFYYMAFSYLPAAIVTMLLYTYPIMVFIYSTTFKNQILNLKKVIALIIAFLGCILTLNISFSGLKYSVIGISLGLLSAVFYSFMNIYSEEKLGSMPPLTINLYSTFFSLISLMIYNFPSFIFEGKVKLEGLMYIAILAVFCEIVPLTLLYSAIKYIGSVKVSIIGNIEIPTTMLMSYFVLNERMSVMQVIGGGFVISAVYLIKEKPIKSKLLDN